MMFDRNFRLESTILEMPFMYAMLYHPMHRLKAVLIVGAHVEDVNQEELRSVTVMRSRKKGM